MLILGILDSLAALLLVRGFYSVSIPEAIIFLFALYLFGKALIFIADIGSWMDIGAGLLLILSLSHPLPQIILLIFAGLLGLKGAMSIIGGVR